MPTINLTIRRAWRHTGEGDRIHYMIDRHDDPDRPRHLFVDPGAGLYEHLDTALLAQGYREPKSASEH